MPQVYSIEEGILQRWADIFQKIEIGIIIARVEDMVMDLVNPAFARMHGWTVEELAGKHSSFVFAPESLEEIPKCLKIVEEKGAHTFEAKHIRKDGSVFPVLMNVRIVKDADSNPLYCVVTVEDITERKVMEESLRKDEEQYRLLFERNPHPMWVFDVETFRFLAVNQAAVQHYGYSQEEFLSMTLKDIRPSKDIPRFMKYQEKIYRQGDPPFPGSAGKWKHRKKNGTLIDVEITWSPLVFNGRKAELVMVNDVTEKLEAENKLLESEAKLRAVLQNAPDFILSVNREGKIIYINRVQPGLEIEKVIGSDARDYLPSNQQHIFEEDLKKVFETGQTASHEIYATGANGQMAWYHSRLAPIIQDGKIVAVNIIAQDITEQKKSQELLQTTEHNQRLVLDNVDEVVYMVRLNPTEPFGGETLFASNQVKKIFGYGPEDFLKDHSLWARLIYPEDIPMLKEQTRKIFNSKKAGTRIFRMWNQERTEYHWMEDRIVPEFDETGKVVTLFGVARDITEAKKSEDQLRKSQDRFRAAMEGSFDSLFMYSAIRDEKGKVTDFRVEYVNEKGLKSSNVTLDKVQGRTAIELFPPYKNSKVFEIHKQVFLTQKGKSDDTYLDMNGKRMWFERHVIPMKDGIAVTLHDITERKNAEEELRGSRQRLQDLSEHLQTMREEERRHVAREIHDELGQMLTALKMDLSWMDERLGVPMERKNYPKMLSHKTKSMLEIINKAIRDVRRISTELHPSILDDMGLTAAMEWHAQEFQKRMKIKCALNLEGDFPLTKNAAATIFRIFQESLTNVARHAKATSVKINLYHHRKQHELILEVKDNGHGIKMEDISQTRTFGLFGMHERVNHLNGKLKITGRAGKGTTLLAVFPIKNLTHPEYSGQI